MSNKPEDNEKKEKVGILRKRDTTAGSSNGSSAIKSTLINRSKPAASGNKPPPKPIEEGGSIFSRRTKMCRDKPSTVPVTRHLTKSTISSCHSTTTLDSRITATSQSSLSHKPGQLPAYLRNKTASSSKNLVAVQAQFNKKQFHQIKKDLSDMQSKAVDYYKKYRESVVKLNKLNGQDDVPAIENLKIVDFNENNDPDLESEAPPSDLKLAENISFHKLKQITDEGVIGQITEQVQEIQEPSIKLLQEFSTRLAEINSLIKSPDSAESGDTNYLPTKIQNLFDEIEKKISEEEEKQKLRTSKFVTDLKQVMINEEGVPIMMKDAIPDEYENFKKANQLKISELENKIKEIELKKIHEEHRNAELTKTITNERSSIKELKGVIAQFEAKRDERETEVERYLQKLKQLDVNNKRYEKLIEGKTNEIALKDKSISELKTSVKQLQDKLTKITNQTQKMESKMTRAGEESKNLIDQYKIKYEEEVKINEELRNEIDTLNLSLEADNKPMVDENEQLKTNQTQLEKEINTLKLNLTEMIHNKTLAEKARADELNCRREMVRLEEDLKRTKTTVNEMKENINNREVQLGKKNREITELEGLVKKLEQRDKSMEFKAEILRLKNENCQKTKENEQLQNDLNKAIADLRLQEESLFMQQRLLKIRSELIQSLQDNEDAAKNHLVELNAEIDKKTYVMKQLNQEVSSKTEELENLFSTLGAKNLEVKRQDHIIKLLEETHERNQKVRVKQEEKISRLEKENAELKRLIKYKG